MHKKRRVGSWFVYFSLALLKQQVMVYPDVTTSHLIGVETPAILLPFLDFFTNILVMLDFHAHVFFQLNITFCKL